MFANTLSNAEMANIKNVHLDEFNKLVIHDFSFEIKYYFKLWLQLEFFSNSNFGSSKQSQMIR
jgi:hypothetical protein